MRAPVDFNVALIQPVAPFAQRIGRQGQRRNIFTYAHSAPVHRFHVHRPERLHAAIALVRADAKALPAALSQSFFLLFAAFLSTQFCLIFRKLARGFLASEHFDPARECPVVQAMLTAIRLARTATTLPGVEMNRPPFTPGLVLEMFRTHRRFSAATENPKWNENTSSKRGAGLGRLPGEGVTAR